MKIKNVKVAFLEESIMRSGLPHQVGEPIDMDDKFPLHESINLDNDIVRAEKLAKVPSGSGHDNFLKGVIVQFDLQYPEYFSPQLQRYSWIDIISSQSKMHKITSRELTSDDFECHVLVNGINQINEWINAYNKDDCTKGAREALFQSIIANLPSGYLKWMGISTNYLQLKTIYKQRKNHKLTEWQYFCKFIETLPMSELIIEA